MYRINFPLYDKQGHVNISGIIDHEPENLCWKIVVLGRATGKTFGAFKKGVERADAGMGQFIYMRRTQDQCSLISKPELSPINDLNREIGTDLMMNPITSKNSGIYHSEINKEGNLVPKGDFLGITAGLSTFRNLRGLSLKGCSLMIYDECVPEPTERALKNEGKALENAYETVNRNRELMGHPPLICLCMGNADDLGCPVFMDLMLTDRIEWMIKNGREYYFDFGRRIAIYVPHDSPISKAKENTALYQMSGNGSFSRMALANRFAEEAIPNIKAQPLKEYRPLVYVPGMCVYKHKDRSVYYCTTHKSGSPEEFGDSWMDLNRFRRKYMYLWEAYLRENITFESYSTMREFENAFTG